jgi:hypothetical protein
MKIRTSRNLHRAAVFAAALGFAVSASAAAQAFTFQDAEGGSAGGARSGYKDLDIPKVPNNAPDSRFSSGNGQTTMRDGNTTLQFGSRPSFNEQYNPNNMFNPYYRDGRW